MKKFVVLLHDVILRSQLRRVLTGFKGTLAIALHLSDYVLGRRLMLLKKETHLVAGCWVIGRGLKKWAEREATRTLGCCIVSRIQRLDIAGRALREVCSRCRAAWVGDRGRSLPNGRQAIVELIVEVLIIFFHMLFAWKAVSTVLHLESSCLCHNQTRLMLLLKLV